MLWFRPSRILGLLLFLELGLFFALVLWESCLDNWRFVGRDAPKLVMSNWLFLIGVVSAITGWIVSSYITLRNSIKQHTINTLLQSRLSATYMTEAKLINKTFFNPGMPETPVDINGILDPEKFEERAAVDYIMNYFEFLAAGIRHGDLDKKVLRHTMKGMLIRYYEKMQPYIKYMRGDDGTIVERPTQLEHMTWLYHEWKDTKK